ncbi:MAG: hypothetical protein ACI4E1_13750 [Lachnospira sp.]
MMEIKEFLNRKSTDKISNKTDKQPDEGTKNTLLNKYKLPLIIAVIATCITVIMVVFLTRERFDVMDYITVKYEGANGYATPVAELDKEGLYEYLSGDKEDSDRTFMIKKLVSSIKVTTESKDVKNGDKITFNITYNDGYAKETDIKINREKFTVKAAGISKGEEIELFENVDVTFAGISPNAYVIIENGWEDEYLSKLNFTASQSEGVAVGNTITVSCTTDFDEIARHGFLVKKTETEYTADRLAYFATNASQVKMDAIDEICKEIDETIKKETEDKTFRMLFKATQDKEHLKHENIEQAEDCELVSVYFLTRKNEEEKNVNYLYIFVKSKISDEKDSEEVYFSFEYSNAYVQADEVFDFNHESEEKRYDCDSDLGELYNRVVVNRAETYDIVEVSY